METVNNRERKLYFDNQIRSSLLNHIISFYCFEAPRDVSPKSFKTATALLIPSFQRFLQLVFVLLKAGAERSPRLASV